MNAQLAQNTIIHRQLRFQYMKFYPSEGSTKKTDESTEKDLAVVKWLALIFAFISVYGIAFKLVFL